jgi:ABC-type transport system substrate-binding protein
MQDPADLSLDWRSQEPHRVFKLWAYNNPVIDQLFDRGKRFSEIDQRRPIYQELHQRLYDDQPALFLYFFYNLGAVSNRFAGTDELFTPAMPFWTIKDWGIHRRPARTTVQSGGDAENAENK